MFNSEFITKPKCKQDYENHERAKGRYKYDIDANYFKHNFYEPHETHLDSEYSVIGSLPTFNNCKNKLVLNKSSLPLHNPNLSFQHSYHPASWLNGF